MPETLLSPSNILLFGKVVEDLVVNSLGDKGDRHSPFIAPRTGGNAELETQLHKDLSPKIARIYGFSYEGTYYDMPRPPLFLVHGEGEPVSLDTNNPKDGQRVKNAAGSPGDPSLSGVAAAEFQFSDGLRAWSYDKADHTIRMDVEAGEFQEVLLGMFFGDEGPAVSGARVSGARVSGARVSGARVSGARVSGARLSGGSSD
jgi:hypothetical protein